MANVGAIVAGVVGGAIVGILGGSVHGFRKGISDVGLSTQKAADLQSYAAANNIIPTSEEIDAVRNFLLAANKV